MTSEEEEEKQQQQHIVTRFDCSFFFLFLFLYTGKHLISRTRGGRAIFGVFFWIAVFYIVFYLFFFNLFICFFFSFISIYLLPLFFFIVKGAMSTNSRKVLRKIYEVSHPTRFHLYAVGTHSKLFMNVLNRHGKETGTFYRRCYDL